MQMDTDTVDQEYQRLQEEFQDAANSVQALAGKLKAAADAGNADAREWLLDLKQIALDIKDEQVQTTALLQAIHSLVANESQQAAAFEQQGVPYPPGPGGQSAAYPPQQGYQQTPYPQQGYQQQGYPQQGGGFFSRFLNSGFGRAVEFGAGMGLGDDLINSIF
jgi:hypothetical protein